MSRSQVGEDQTSIMPPTRISKRCKGFFDRIWRQGDFWQLESSPFERAKYERQAALLADRRYRRVLEVGCGAGAFTRQLSTLAEHVLAVDVAPAAIERALANRPAGDQVEFQVADIMEHDFGADPPWDLIVISETIYYLGWLYSFFDVAWLVHKMFAVTESGGRAIMVNTLGTGTDYLLYPWIIRTYRDLFVNAGYALQVEEVLRGVKKGIELEALITLFAKPLQE